MPRIAVLGVCAHVPPIASREHRSRKMDRFIIDRCDQSVLHSKGTYSSESCNTLGIFFSTQLQAGGLYERKGVVFTEGGGTASTGIEEGSSKRKETGAPPAPAAAPPRGGSGGGGGQSQVVSACYLWVFRPNGYGCFTRLRTGLLRGYFLLKITSSRGTSVKVGKVAPASTLASEVTKLATSEVPATTPLKPLRIVMRAKGVVFL